MPEEVIVRPALESDMPYVLSTWVRSYGSGVPNMRRQQAIVAFRKRYVDRIMGMHPRIMVLCSPESRGTLHGYAIEHRGALAWVYVTRELRKMGMAKKAIRAALSDYPEDIRVHCAWPFPTTRFRFERLAA